MVWILDALSGFAEDNEDGSVDSGDERNEASKMANDEQGSLQNDLSELKQSFSKHLMGVASFLAGDDIAASSSSGSPVDRKPSSKDVENSVRGDGDAAEVAPLLEPRSHSTEESGSFQGPNSSLDKDTEFQTAKMAGVKSDLAEFKDTVTSGLSHFSAVLGLVAGEDLLPSLDKGKGKLSEGQVSEHRDIVGGEGTAHSKEQHEGSITSAFSLASGIGSISKLASDFLAFNVDNSDDEDGERDGDLGNAVGLTEEVLAFANNVAAHPETWLDFPLPETDSDKEFELSEAQEGHVRALEFHSARLVALRMELCPAYMTEERFWKIYFVLLHSRLHPDDAALLSTPQIVAAREQVLENLRKRSSRPVVEAEEEEDDGMKVDAMPGSSPTETMKGRHTLPAETAAHATDEKSHSQEGHADKESPVEKSVADQGLGEKPERGAVVSEEKSGEDAVEKPTSAGAQGFFALTTPSSPAVPAEVAVAEKVGSSITKLVEAGPVVTTGKSAEADEDEEVDEWLDDSGERGGSETEAEEDVSFSDLEDDEDENGEGKEVAEGGVEKEGITGGPGKGKLGWIQLGKSEKGNETGADRSIVDEESADSMSSSPSRGGKGGSPSGDSSEWLKVNGPEETLEQH